MRRILSATAAVAVVLSSFMAFAGTAQAHETRKVGPYTFVVGWLGEPAYQGQPNAATMRISDPRVTPAKPMEGLADALSIQVFSGGLTKAFTGKLRAVFGQPGLYALDVIPTVSGGYKYKITGKVEATDVNETFESGPTTFGEILPVSALQYPEPVPGGADLTQQLADLKSAVDQTRIIAILAVVIGLAGLGAGFAMRRRA